MISGPHLFKVSVAPSSMSESLDSIALPTALDWDLSVLSTEFDELMFVELVALTVSLGPSCAAHLNKSAGAYAGGRCARASARILKNSVYAASASVVGRSWMKLLSSVPWSPKSYLETKKDKGWPHGIMRSGAYEA